MIGKVLTVPDVREFYATQNVEVLLMTPAEFSAKVRADHDKWGKSLLLHAAVQQRRNTFDGDHGIRMDDARFRQ